MTVRRVRTSLPALLIAVGVLAAGGGATPPSSEADPVLVSPAQSPISTSAEKAVVPAAPSDEAADNPVDRVLAISIDGLNPRAIQQLGRSDTMSPACSTWFTTMGAPPRYSPPKSSSTSTSAPGTPMVALIELGVTTG